MRADSHNGYVGDFHVYTGSTDNTPEINLGGRVVLDLMQPLLDLGYHVYTDSFFTSPDLFLQLRKRSTLGCGTVRSNRKGLPTGLDKLKMKEQGVYH